MKGLYSSGKGTPEFLYRHLFLSNFAAENQREKKPYHESQD